MLMYIKFGSEPSAIFSTVTSYFMLVMYLFAMILTGKTIGRILTDIVLCLTSFCVSKCLMSSLF